MAANALCGSSVYFYSCCYGLGRSAGTCRAAGGRPDAGNGPQLGADPTHTLRNGLIAESHSKRRGFGWLSVPGQQSFCCSFSHLQFF